uniref:Uncharacterized protein n=1 Tax=Oryza sativa subsp. japonica TaxID=39947 RepID=Q8LIJ5_ORYSJ|nr:hypothetical protein [Oryza sativa Japonica Group]
MHCLPYLALLARGGPCKLQATTSTMRERERERERERFQGDKHGRWGKEEREKKERR